MPSILSKSAQTRIAFVNVIAFPHSQNSVWSTHATIYNWEVSDLPCVSKQTVSGKVGTSWTPGPLVWAGV